MDEAGKAGDLIQSLGSAILRLSEALRQPEDEFIRDAAIQRFEFCFELLWKAIQALARLEGHLVGNAGRTESHFTYLSRSDGEGSVRQFGRVSAALERAAPILIEASRRDQTRRALSP